MEEMGIDCQLGQTRASSELMATFGFDYHYYGDMRQYGADGTEWRDGRHLSESNSLRMLLALLESHPTILEPYIDAERACALLSNFTNPINVLHELPPL